MNMSNAYYTTKESVEEYIQLAKDVNGKQLIDKLVKILPPGSSLLEIGSGPGSDWKILCDHYKVVGSDFSAEFIHHLKKTYPGEKFLELDASTLKTNTHFDGIYSNKVLHHLTDEALQASIKRQHEILTTGGIVCHSFWKGEGTENFKGMFVNYHSEKDLKIDFEDYFSIVSIDTYQEFEANDSILLIAKNKA